VVRIVRILDGTSYTLYTVLFLSPSQQPEYLKLDYTRFLPKPFQFRHYVTSLTDKTVKDKAIPVTGCEVP
jgi:hypothetical protein